MLEMIKGKITATLMLLAFSSLSLFASQDAETKAGKKNDNSAVFEHIMDSHEWHIMTLTSKDGSKKHISVPLPIILWSGKSLDVFMSSNFHHGHESYTINGNTYFMHENKIYFVCPSQNIQEESAIHEENLTEIQSEDSVSHGSHDIESLIMKDENGEILNQKPLDFSITKNTLSLFLSFALLLLIFIPAARAYKKRPGAPKGIQSFVEPLILFVRDDIAIPNLGEHKYEKYLPYLLTLFFCIWINNMMGLIPIFPFGANLTGNIAVTLVLAIFTFIITNVSAKKTYWKHIVAMPGIPAWILPIMVPVEIIGIFTKPFALMIRLFANITAGHMIVLSLISMIFVFGTVLFSPVSIFFVLFMDVLELLVAALQAYIFTTLSALYISLAIHEDH